MDITRHWYKPSLTWLTILLLPFSLLFFFIVKCRVLFYKLGLIKVQRFSVPVIVVGNITVGGTGKTPCVIWLANFLKAKGFRPGIITRGYGGATITVPRRVDELEDPAIVGDEAILLTYRTQCPVYVSVNRVAAAKQLLANTTCNVIISDDGLQHYRLGRDIEIAVIDGQRRFGNGFMLPTGPLREPISRLRQVNFVVAQGKARRKEILMELKPECFIHVVSKEQKSLDGFAKQNVHAVAAIGNPSRFFALLNKLRIKLKEHVFRDHYLFAKEDIIFQDDLPVVMTEKDAVKCKNIAGTQHWYLRVETQIESSDFANQILNKIGEKI